MKKPANNLKLKFCILTVLLICLFSCKKDKQVPKEEAVKANLIEHAAYNDNIVKGVGNVFYQTPLKANKPSQLLVKLAYFQDTVAYYGSTNAAAKVENIHTVLIAKKGGKELFVMESLFSANTVRLYSITDNMKDKFILEIRQLSSTLKEISILEMNWETGVSKSLYHSAIDNGQQLSYTSSIPQNNKMGNVPVTASKTSQTEEEDYGVNEFGKWSNTLGLSKILDFLKENYSKFQDKLTKKEQEKLTRNVEEQERIAKETADRHDEFKHENEDLNSDLNHHENSEPVEPAKDKREILLQFVNENTALNYDQRKDKLMTFIFEPIDKKTGLPIVDLVIGMDIKTPKDLAIWFKSKETRALSTRATWEFDPVTSFAYDEITTLKLEYYFYQNGLKVTQSKTLNLKYITAELATITGGNYQTSIPGQKLNKPLQVKVTSADGFPIDQQKVQWKVKTGGGTLNFAETATNAEGLTQVDWTLGTSIEVQEIEATVKKRNGEPIPGSPLIFKTAGISSLTGNWEAYEIIQDETNVFKNTAYSELSKNIKCNKAGKFRWNTESLVFNFNEDNTFKATENSIQSDIDLDTETCLLLPEEHRPSNEEVSSTFSYDVANKTFRLIKGDQYIIFKIISLTETDLSIQFSQASPKTDKVFNHVEFFDQEGSAKFRRK